MSERQSESLRNWITAAMLLAIGMLLPFFTGQIKEIGDSLLPMHLPVLLCGLLLGTRYGALVGGLLPLLRAVLFSMPPLYPNALWMAAELLTYGAMSGFLYRRFHKRNLLALYLSLIGAQLAGRIVWGVVKATLLGFADKPFPFTAFLAGGFADAALGIVLQWILVPAIVTAVQLGSHRADRNK